MSVFHKAKSVKPTGSERHIPCNQYHRIGEMIPQVNGAIHSVQHPEWMGKACACRKMVYSEGMCGCPGVDSWQINWNPNPNY